MCWLTVTVTGTLDGAEPLLLLLSPPVFHAVTSHYVLLCNQSI